MDPSSIPRSKPLAVTGTILFSAPIFGAVSTAIAMANAFETLKVAGAADPNQLAGHIGHALYGTLIGFTFGLIGIVLVNIALFKNHNREPWFYRSVLFLSVIWCLLAFPLGLVPGIFMIHHFSKRKNEFFPSRKPQ